MEKLLFGDLGEEKVYEYILSNDKIEAHILNYGGIIKNLIFDGVDVVCGFDTLQDYRTDSSYQGALIGRYANRIRKAEFTMNGKKYKIGKNEGNNHLHGGVEGFNRKIWNVDKASDEAITLSLFSPDGDEGFPASVKAFVTYKLCDTSLCIDYTASSDGDTALNMTNHAYFNLNGCGEGNILDHEIKINADYVTLVDHELLPVKREKVDGTVFDLRSFTKLGQHVDENFKGYDHNFVISDNAPTQSICGHSLKEIAQVSNQRMKMTVYTDQECVQLYAGLSLGGTPIFKNHTKRVNYGAFCLETQVEPDSPNNGKGILRATETYRHTTIYRFEK